MTARTRTRISKDDGKKKTFRLTDIEVEYVSLVRAGANRQKQFQVIKEDEQGLGPGGTCVCVSCGHEEAHETGVKCSDLKCSKCGGTMKRKEDKEDDAEKVVPGLTPPQTPGPTCPNCGKKLPKPMPDKCPSCGHPLKIADDNNDNGDPDGQGDADKTGDNNANGDQAGDDSTQGSGIDLSSWLDEAGAEVEALSLDQAIQQALDGQFDGDADGDTPAQKAQKIEGAGAPPVVAKEEVEDEKDRRIAKLETELRKTRLDLTKSRATAARLAKGVGKSSVMLTGEVVAKDSQQDATEASSIDGAFQSGDDIAAAVARSEKG